MTYYGDSNGAVTALEQDRLDVMPSDTLDVQDAKRLQRTSGVHVYRSPPIGLEYWVFNLAPHVTSRVHTAVVRDRAIRSALAWAIDRSELVRASLFGFGAPGNTQLPRSYGHFSVDLSDDPELGYHYDPAKARRILEQAGWQRRPRRHPREGRRARRVRARLRRQRGAGETRRDADPGLGARRGHPDRRARVRHRQADQPRVQQGRRQADARLRHGDLVDRRRPDAGVPALALHEGPDRRLERLGLRRQAVRGALQGRAARRRARARARPTSTGCSASPRASCRTSSSTRPTTSAPSTRARGPTGRHSPHPPGSRSPSTATRRSPVCGRAGSRRRAIRASRGRSPASGCSPPSPSARRSSPTAVSGASRSSCPRRRTPRNPKRYPRDTPGRREVGARARHAGVRADVQLLPLPRRRRPQERPAARPAHDRVPARAADPRARARPLRARPVRHLRAQHALGPARDELPQRPARLRRDRRRAAQHAHPRAAGDAPRRTDRHLDGHHLGAAARQQGRRGDHGRLAHALLDAGAVPRDRGRARVLDLAEGVPEPALGGARLDRARLQPRLGRHPARRPADRSR